MVPVRSARLRLTLRQGTVYLMSHRGLTSPLPHYLVVLNQNPLSGELLVLSVVTSNVAFRRERASVRGQPPETIVEFGPSDYPVLAHPSCIDCNDVKIMSASEFERCALSRSSNPKADLPSPILARVVAGILASSSVSEAVKALVRPSP